MDGERKYRNVGSSGAVPGAARTLLSLAAFVAFWSLLSALKADASVLPGPLAVAREIWREAVEGPLVFHLGATLARVALAFVLAMALGGVIGLLLGLYPRSANWLGAWVSIFLNLPALVLIVLCYIWIGLNETAAILAVMLSKTPMVIVTMREGASSFDRGLGDMARVFRFSLLARIRHLYLPQLGPYIAASARNGLAVIWKIVLVVEFLGRSNGVGFQIHLYFQLFEIAHVLAYAVSFTAIMLAVEHALIGPLSRRAGRWRASAT
jgi:NitT/TauT family transport system permease protein